VEEEGTESDGRGTVIFYFFYFLFLICFLFNYFLFFIDDDISFNKK
jgi:hypothetical protein